MRLRAFGGLWLESATPLPALGARRMALLAIVASAGKRGISRERVAGILWGDSSEADARHSLSQNLYSIRRDTGADWIAAAPRLSLNNGSTSDIGDFIEAVESEDHRRVAELYLGSFLQDFHLSGAPHFEQWVEEERVTLRRAALRSLEALAARAPNGESVQWWRRLTEIDGLNGQYAAGLIRALMQSGDLVAALAHARNHEEVVRRELEADVDQAVRKLITELRSKAHADGRIGGSEETTGETDPDHRVVARSAEPPIRRARVGVAVAVTVALGLLVGVRLLDRPRLSSTTLADPPTIAVGAIRSTDTTVPGAVLRDMLATSLGGVEGIAIVANSRLLELAAPADSSGAALSSAARRAGARELLEGEMTLVTGGVRLAVRRVDLTTGVVRGAWSVQAAGHAGLIDSATAVIARELGVESPTRSVATRRTASSAAYALYERGLQAYYRGDARTAHTLMRAAWEQDTAFAMAAFFGWLASTSWPLQRDEALLEAARRLAPRTIDRERLLIATTVAWRDSSLPSSLAIAETLAVRYPEDPEGHLALGMALEMQGDFPRAILEYERAVAIDSAAGPATGPSCRLCNALYRMSVAFMWSDSLEASLRTARRMRRLRPGEFGHWAAMAEPLFRLGRRAEAQAALDSSAEHSIPSDAPRELGRRDLVRWGEFETLDRHLTADLTHPAAEVRTATAWLMLINLRNQGRLREASALARERAEPIHNAFLPMELGNPAESARLFRIEAERRRTGHDPPGIRARYVAWYLTLAGTALARAGDTAAVRRLADSVEVIGRGSSFGRDFRLHQYLRGLLDQQGGRHAEAIRRFRLALHSVSDGYTRINYEMARCLLQVDRPQEAIDVLRPALRGGVDGSNTYLTFTELHEVMAQAFEMAGVHDSARVHYAAVEKAWRRADPHFAERYARAKERAGQ
jgi:DNA-binding SARP family transcriptional activator